MALVTINALPPSQEQARAWCEQLESGDILFFPHTPIALQDEDLTFLLDRQQSNSNLHKHR
jgi:hypothetical protein